MQIKFWKIFSKTTQRILRHIYFILIVLGYVQVVVPLALLAEILADNRT